MSKTAVCSVNMQPVVTNLIESVNSFQLHVTRHESRAHPESGTHFLIEFFLLIIFLLSKCPVVLLKLQRLCNIHRYEMILEVRKSTK